VVSGSRVSRRVFSGRLGAACWAAADVTLNRCRRYYASSGRRVAAAQATGADSQAKAHYYQLDDRCWRPQLDAEEKDSEQDQDRDDERAGRESPPRPHIASAVGAERDGQEERCEPGCVGGR